METSTFIWSPDGRRIHHSKLTGFMKAASRRMDREFRSYDELHKWSVQARAQFWDLVWDELGIIGEKGNVVIEPGPHMLDERFFPEARLNFAENLLRNRGDGDAIVFYGEDKVRSQLSWNELHALVSRLQQLFRSLGVKEGDRIAAMMPNIPETVAAMLAVTSMGAIWACCSPDFGERGVLDRFGQIEPVVLLVPDGYWYAGKRIDIERKVAAISKSLTSVRSILVVNYVDPTNGFAKGIDKAVSLNDALSPFEAKEFSFEQLPFDHPLYVLFSSGTTGAPKCIVHSAGGTLLQHTKEHRLHSDIGEGDRVFYFTTCGWMMWNWLVSALGSGATLVLYDGSPFSSGVSTLFDLIDEEKVTFFGTSAKFIDTVRKSAGPKPIASHDLSSLKTIASTGSPLSPESFRFVYESIKSDVHLASIAGGTDIVSCFVLGVPTEPVFAGEIQAPGLGLAVDVWGDDGVPIRGSKGELVCTKAFPSMPIGFWDDPEKQRYKAAYFERFPEVWCHGDLAEWAEGGGLVIHGRSDATLNPGGVRIGTAEIYNIVEQMPEVLEAVCIGQDWDDDVRVVLFVRLAAGVELTPGLQATIKAKIRLEASPRHVPAKIAAVTDIPRTKSGKIMELAVRDAVHGLVGHNTEALANPGALAEYRDIQELSS